MTNFYSEEELAELGLKSFGKKVLLSKKASVYGACNIEIGDNVRIDDFCILSGNIKINSHVHIGAASHVFAGTAGVEFHDFTCISGRCAIYAVTDDYSGQTLTNAVLPEKYKGVTEESVVLERHALIGTNSTVLPGVVVKQCCAVGAHSLVTASTEAYGIYVGTPAKRVRERKNDMLKLEKQFLEEWNKQNV
mgnify:CR=1 FL=1